MADKEHDRTTSAGSQGAPLKPERVQKEVAEPAGGALKPERVQKEPGGPASGAAAPKAAG